jgi:hypothetical protein
MNNILKDKFHRYKRMIERITYIRGMRKNSIILRSKDLNNHLNVENSP